MIPVAALLLGFGTALFVYGLIRGAVAADEAIMAAQADLDRIEADWEAHCEVAVANGNPNGSCPCCPLPPAEVERLHQLFLADQRAES